VLVKFIRPRPLLLHRGTHLRLGEPRAVLRVQGVVADLHSIRPPLVELGERALGQELPVAVWERLCFFLSTKKTTQKKNQFAGQFKF
jgi:hypothetical protein